jgi:hypothetical protein
MYFYLTLTQCAYSSFSIAVYAACLQLAQGEAVSTAQFAMPWVSGRNYRNQYSELRSSQIHMGNTTAIFVIRLTNDKWVIRSKHKSEGGENAGST